MVVRAGFRDSTDLTTIELDVQYFRARDELADKTDEAAISSCFAD